MSINWNLMWDFIVCIPCCYRIEMFSGWISNNLFHDKQYSPLFSSILSFSFFSFVCCCLAINNRVLKMFLIVFVFFYVNVFMLRVCVNCVMGRLLSHHYHLRHAFSWCLVVILEWSGEKRISNECQHYWFGTKVRRTSRDIIVVVILNVVIVDIGQWCVGIFSIFCKIIQIEMRIRLMRLWNYKYLPSSSSSSSSSSSKSSCSSSSLLSDSPGEK